MSEFLLMQVACPACFGRDDDCYTCHGSGIVCPTCRGARKTARHRDRQGSVTIPCQVCGELHQGLEKGEIVHKWHYTPDREADAVAEWLALYSEGLATSTEATRRAEVARQLKENLQSGVLVKKQSPEMMTARDRFAARRADNGPQARAITDHTPGQPKPKPGQGAPK